MSCNVPKARLSLRVSEGMKGGVRAGWVADLKCGSFFCKPHREKTILQSRVCRREASLLAANCNGFRYYEGATS